MKTLDLFFQGHGLGEIQHLSVELDATFGAIRTQLVQKYSVLTETFVFVEDGDDPLDDDAQVADYASAAALKLHFSRCSKVEVLVTFNGETVRCHFAPSATVSRVKKWVAESKFKMSEVDAGEHVLQISGTHDRPAPGTHIGVLVLTDTCEVKFDLVPDERVNGAAEGGR